VSALLDSVDLPYEGLDDQFGDAWIVAERDGRLIGSAAVEVYGRHGLLRSVAVDPSARGLGLGADLVRDRLAWSAARGLDSVWLLTTTAPDWFTRFGFGRVPRQSAPALLQESPEFATICPGDSVAMTRPLNTEPVSAPAPESVSGPGHVLRATATAAPGLPVVQDCATTTLTPDEIRAQVREKYGAAAKLAQAGAEANCGCGCGCGDTEAAADPITSDLYDEAETSGLPVEAVLASLGCGNPTALAELAPGEVVLDLGSGGGIDVLLSAKRVGPSGRAYGVDMTDEMLELARANQRKSGIENVEFLKGGIEDVPLPDASVDVIISNCVINLSADKSKVLREAYRVLRPGGRFAVSDIVVRGAMPDAVRRNVELWVGCVAGALEEDEYKRLLTEAGFHDVDIEPTRIYSGDDVRALLGPTGVPDDEVARAADGSFMSAFVRGIK
jgi:SAM-dependent methyltransferase/N-acetylglutamate synthase-like GNAT family acetyltransferase